METSFLKDRPTAPLSLSTKSEILDKSDSIRFTRARELSKAYKEKSIQGKKISDFKDVYEDEIIDEVLNKVNQFKKDNKDFITAEDKISMCSECLEGIMLSVPNWFGFTYKLSPTTEFDDYFRRVDLIATKEDGSDPMAFDITFSGIEGIEKKIERNINRILKGKLSNLLFFQSPDKTYKGKLSNTPAFVIGTDFDTMRDLINLFAEDNTNSKKRISEHPIQFQIIDTIVMQCRIYKLFLEKRRLKLTDNSNMEIVKKRLYTEFDRVEKQMIVLYQMKVKNTLKSVDSNYRDRFYTHLQSILNRLESDLLI